MTPTKSWKARYELNWSLGTSTHLFKEIAKINRMERYEIEMKFWIMYRNGEADPKHKEKFKDYVYRMAEKLKPTVVFTQLGD